MTIKELREQLPSWKWKATRSGFGWNYTGSINEPDGHLVQVLVYPVASWTGWEDHYETQWRVEHGLHSESYSSFFIKESTRVE